MDNKLQKINKYLGKANIVIFSILGLLLFIWIGITILDNHDRKKEIALLQPYVKDTIDRIEDEKFTIVSKYKSGDIINDSTVKMIYGRFVLRGIKDTTKYKELDNSNFVKFVNSKSVMLEEYDKRHLGDTLIFLYLIGKKKDTIDTIIL